MRNNLFLLEVFYLRNGRPTRYIANTFSTGTIIKILENAKRYLSQYHVNELTCAIFVSGYCLQMVELTPVHLNYIKELFP